MLPTQISRTNHFHKIGWKSANDSSSDMICVLVPDLCRASGLPSNNADSSKSSKVRWATGSRPQGTLPRIAPFVSENAESDPAIGWVGFLNRPKLGDCAPATHSPKT
jgi:hypothetical protein